MSLQSWLTGGGTPKPGAKRKRDSETTDNIEIEPPKKKFSKEMNQTSFEWYIMDEGGKWHCTLCRTAIIETAYAIGHDKPAKTTNHILHPNCYNEIKIK